MKFMRYFFAVLILGFGFVFWESEQVSDQIGDSDTVPVKEVVIPVPLNEIGESDTATKTQTEDLAEFARRFIHVPDTRHDRDINAPTTDEHDITAENIDSLVQANLDHALTGDMASAYFVARSRMTCDRFASTSEELENSISRVNHRMERSKARGQEFTATAEIDQPWSVSGDADTNRVNMERWFDACQRLDSLFSPDLRQRLEMMALRGDVMARYLYATWPEEQLEAGEAFDQQFRWEDLAREFSLANMNAGEVAGLMAFGHSYLGGSFTSRDANLALAFGVAALNCGFETVSVRSYLASSIEKLTSSEDPADQLRFQFVLTESDRLTQFCLS
jgi:hypothetical protein